MGNSNSRIDPSQEPTKEQLKYLQNLPAKHRAMIIDALDETTEKAKAVIVHHYTPSAIIPTKKQIGLTYQDCYAEIARGNADENYVFSVIHALVYQANNSGYLNGKEVQEAVEQLINLASRLVKGEQCSECDIDYTSPNRLSTGVQEDAASGMMEIVDEARENDVLWELGYKSKFALAKLSSIFPTPYQPLQYLIQDENKKNVLYETMWCHENVKLFGVGDGYDSGEEDEGYNEYESTCNCWDQGFEGAHVKYCYWGERGPGNSHL
jgi:hypothetical protein